MCIYCDEQTHLELDGCCPTCLVDYRIEVALGIRRLGDYLAAWSAFEDWCRERQPAAA